MKWLSPNHGSTDEHTNKEILPCCYYSNKNISILIINGKLSIDNWRGFNMYEGILFWVQKIHLKKVSVFCALSRHLHRYYMKILDWTFFIRSLKRSVDFKWLTAFWTVCITRTTFYRTMTCLCMYIYKKWTWNQFGMSINSDQIYLTVKDQKWKNSRKSQPQYRGLWMTASLATPSHLTFHPKSARISI